MRPGPRFLGASLCTMMLVLGGRPAAVVAGKWSQPGGKGNPITLTFSYTNLLTGEGIERASGFNDYEVVVRTEQALAFWSKYAPITFKQKKDGSSVDIRIGLKELPGNTIGSAQLPPYDGYRGSLDLWVDSSHDNWGGTTFRAVVAHELGHNLGLEHWDDGSALMNSMLGGTIYGKLGEGELFTHDVDAIREKYGSGSGEVINTRVWKGPVGGTAGWTDDENWRVSTTATSDEPAFRPTSNSNIKINRGTVHINGTDALGRRMYLGESSDQSGGLKISQGSLNLRHSEGLRVGVDGSGLVEQLGGTVDVQQLRLGGSTPGHTAVYELDGGTLTVRGDIIDTGPGRSSLKLRGGTLRIAGSGIVDVDTLTFTGGSMQNVRAITGDFNHLAGTIGPDNPAGVLDVGGDYSISDGATLKIELDGSAPASRGYGLLAVAGSARLGGTLVLKPIGVGEARGKVTRTILTAAGVASPGGRLGGIIGTFADVPPVYDWSQETGVGHLGLGVFHRGVNYVDADTDGVIDAVTVDLLIANSGDGNGDMFVDAADISRLVERFNLSASDPFDRTWTDMDTAGGPLDRGDGIVDGRDLSVLVAAWTGDPGPADGGTATAQYDPATGRFTVSVDNVVSWTLGSSGKFTGAAMAEVGDHLPLGSAWSLVSANPNTVGEGVPGGPGFSYENVDFGQLAQPGTDVSAFSLQYVVGLGAPVQNGRITVVAEPGTGAMLVVGALLFLLCRRRLTAR